MRKREQISIITLFFAFFMAGLLVYPQAGWTMGSTGENQPAGEVIIFHAGSLTIPFAEMEKEFEARHPGVDIIREAAGSRRCARKITELKKTCDIMASADFTVIDGMLIPEYANWNIRFATNRLVLCYTDKSKYAGDRGSHLKY